MCAPLCELYMVHTTTGAICLCIQYIFYICCTWWIPPSPLVLSGHTDSGPSRPLTARLLDWGRLALILPLLSAGGQSLPLAARLLDWDRLALLLPLLFANG